MLGLKSHTLSFEIFPTNNRTVLLFLDESDYFEKPELPVLRIIPPGHSRYFEVNIEESKLNVINSHLMGYTDVLESEEILELPDGIWEFVYMICPHKYLNVGKYHLRTTKLDCELNTLYNIIDVTNEKDYICYHKDLMNIHILIESAKANTEKGNISKGNKDFSLAQSKVKQLLNKLDKQSYALQYV